MKIEHIFDDFNNTNSYIIYNDNNEAIIIDVCSFEKIDGFIKHKNLCIDYVILTHEHYDHIIGLNKLRENYIFKVLTSEKCSIGIQSDKINLSKYFDFILSMKNKNQFIKTIPYTCSRADIVFVCNYEFAWKGINIYISETPGHSKGSVSIIVDNKYIFSGDTMFKESETATGLPGGSKREYIEITLAFYKTLDRNMIVYPGHGGVFTLREILGEG